MARPADPNARAALISAARREFVKKGLLAARIEDITAACGLSKGAFYLHFKSKDALFGELVAAFTAAMEAQGAARFEKMKGFFDQHGPLKARDVLQRTSRYARMSALEVDCDCRVLEAMWSFRDVLDVLISGSRGTAFEGLVWEMIDREVDRVAADFDQLQFAQACRTDLSPQLFGSFVVGAYFMVSKRMSRMKTKPDLLAWATSLHRLIHEGIVPDASRAPSLRPKAHPSPRAARRSS